MSLLLLLYRIVEDGRHGLRTVEVAADCGAHRGEEEEGQGKATNKLEVEERNDDDLLLILLLLADDDDNKIDNDTPRILLEKLSSCF